MPRSTSVLTTSFRFPASSVRWQHNPPLENMLIPEEIHPTNGVLPYLLLARSNMIFSVDFFRIDAARRVA